jgi:N-acetylglutamate synthase-like GNAT family acetyltransferase
LRAELLRALGRLGLQLSTATPASSADLASVRELLEAAGLPTADLQSARPEFVVIHEGEFVIAAGALQPFGASALLRSVVVAEAQRNRGLGQEVVAELERRASARGIHELYLLTETAGRFFERAGYRRTERSEAPAAVQQSAEFRSLCPSSAACMVKNLTGA